MGDKKKNLIVTLADSNFVAQAKQLFSSVYHNAGWAGDYLLLACNIAENDKEWFRAKGILVYDCESLDNHPIGIKGHPAIVLSKFYLFKEYFKQWQKVIFLDADIIVKASLDNLLSLRGFNAPKAITFKLKDEFTDDGKTLALLKKEYDLNGRAFNTGFFIFDTKLIKENTFSALTSLYRRFGYLNSCGEEGTLNLFFYKKWKMLSTMYNSIPSYMDFFYKINKESLEAVVMHFISHSKPWNPKSDYYLEWINNLNKAEDIDLSHRLKPAKKYSKHKIAFYKYYLLWRIFHIHSCSTWRAIDFKIGKIGLFIKHQNPAIYKLIRFKKNDGQQ